MHVGLCRRLAMLRVRCAGPLRRAPRLRRLAFRGADEPPWALFRNGRRALAVLPDALCQRGRRRPRRHRMSRRRFAMQCAGRRCPRLLLRLDRLAGGRLDGRRRRASTRPRPLARRERRPGPWHRSCRRNAVAMMPMSPVRPPFPTRYRAHLLQSRDAGRATGLEAQAAPLPARHRAHPLQGRDAGGAAGPDARAAVARRAGLIVDVGSQRLLVSDALELAEIHQRPSLVAVCPW